MQMKIKESASMNEKTLNDDTRLSNKDEDQITIVEFDSPPNNHLTFLQKLAFGLGHIFNDLCAAMWFSYTLLFLQVVLHLESTTAGFMMLLGQVMDALATPVIGFLADRRGSKRLWHITGTGLVSISFPLIFSRCLGCWIDSDGDYLKWWQPLYYSTVIVIFQCGWAVVQISHLALIPALTENSKERSELTAIRYMASVCSGVAVYIITWSVLHTDDVTKTNIGSMDDYKFRDIALFLTAIGLSLSIAFHLVLGKRMNVYANPDSTSTSNLNNNQTVECENEIDTNKIDKNILLSPLLYQVALLYVAARLFNALSLVYVPLYLDERLSSQQSKETVEAIASVPLVTYISSFFTSILLKVRGTHINHKALYTLGSLVCTGVCVWIAIFLVSSSETYELYVVAALLGFGGAITMVTSLCITADVIGAKSDRGAAVYSVVTFADKLITGVAVIVIENEKCEERTECPDYYRTVLAYVCGGSAAFGAVVVVVWELCSSTRRRGYLRFE